MRHAITFLSCWNICGFRLSVDLIKRNTFTPPPSPFPLFNQNVVFSNPDTVAHQNKTAELRRSIEIGGA